MIQNRPALQDSEIDDGAIETVTLTPEQAAYLGRLSSAINPDMPAAFGLPFVIRQLIDRFAAAGMDLTGASTEDEIARLAASHLRGEAPGALPKLSASFSSGSRRPAVRRSYRSSPPARGRLRCETTPRSDRG